MNGNGNRSVGKAIVSFIFSGLSIVLGIVLTIVILTNSKKLPEGIIVVCVIILILFFIIGAVVYLLSGLMFLKPNKPNKGCVISFTIVNLLGNGLWLYCILAMIYVLVMLGDKISYFGSSVAILILVLVLALVAFSANIVFSIWLINFAVAYAEREAIISNREVERSREQIYQLNLKIQQLQQQKIIQKAQGIVKGISGVASGIKFSINENSKVVMGRDPHSCNFIVDYPQVSNVHCSIRFNPNTGSYILKDHSSNGTFVNNVKLQKNIPTEFPSGTVVSLADGTNQVRLG